MITVLQRGLLDLDNKIASAIQNLMNGELNLPEPINPMQAMIMSLIQQKMSANKMLILKMENWAFIFFMVFYLTIITFNTQSNLPERMVII